MVNEKIYNLNLTKEEEEYLQGQLKKYREEKAKEEELKKTKKEVETSIRKLHELARRDFTDILDIILAEYDCELSY